MAKERVIKQLTEEQWERIKNTPGVVIYERSDPPSTPFFTPRYRPTRKLNITASDLINAEEDEERSE